MVHRHRQAARRRHGRERRHHPRTRAALHRPSGELHARARKKPAARDDREPPRLGGVASARLGRAADLFSAPRDRRAAARPGRERPHRRRLPRRRRRRLVRRGRRRAVPRERPRPCRLDHGHRHSRRVVRLRFDPRLRAARPGRAMAGRRVSGGLRSASRLVPFLAAAGLRHAGAGALQGGGDARLHARREGREDVEVGRQHRRARQGGQGIRRRHPAAVGGDGGLRRRPAHRPEHPQVGRRRLPPPAQRFPLPAGRARRFFGGRARGPRRHARA